MKSFIDSWSTKFHSDKFPLDFYYTQIEELAIAKSPNRVGELIISMLHWKDGKVCVDKNGPIQVGHRNYEMHRTKPNTYHADKHKQILCSIAFYQWAEEIRSLTHFDASMVLNLSKEFNLYGENSIVIPSFILHVLSPMIFPPYDQHVNRAKHILLSELPLNEKLDLNTYKEYQSYFQSIVFEEFGDEPTMEQMKAADNALWSFGKWAKNLEQKKVVKMNKTPVISEHDRFYTPDEDFKLTVLNKVNLGELSQGQAIREAAQEKGVTLSKSYYDYPGSHIHRWRKQLEQQIIEIK